MLDSVGKRAPGWVVPLSRPDVGDDEIAAVVECLRSGWLTTGPKVKEFEAAFARFLGDGVHTVATSSNTAGLLLALQSLGIGPGDEVVTTTNTHIATGLAIVHAGATPVLVDIDPATLNIDPAKIEAAVTPRTKAIVPVHVAGLACDMDAIGAIAARKGLLVVEDAAHALPTTHRGRLIGNRTADATVFSFYATKTLTTGEGGMIATADPEVAHRARILRLHGVDRDAFDRTADPGRSWLYDVVAPGHKANLPDMAAALGLVQLQRTEAMHARRSAIARRYRQAFADLPLMLPAEPPQGDRHSWHLYIVRLRDDARLDRDTFVRLMAEGGIQCSVHFIPLHRFSWWRDRFATRDANYPAATAAFHASATLPLFSAMTDADVDRVVDAVRRLLA